MRFKKKILKKIDKRKISKKKDCLWNIYRQFGYNIYKKTFKDNLNFPLYKNCVWTEQQELEMIKAMKEKKIVCYIKKTHRIGQMYNCYGCILLFHFPTAKRKNERS